MMIKFARDGNHRLLLFPLAIATYLGFTAAGISVLSLPIAAIRA